MLNKNKTSIALSIFIICACAEASQNQDFSDMVNDFIQETSKKTEGLQKENLNKIFALIRDCFDTIKPQNASYAQQDELKNLFIRDHKLKTYFQTLFLNAAKDDANQDFFIDKLSLKTNHSSSKEEDGYFMRLFNDLFYGFLLCCANKISSDQDEKLLMPFCANLANFGFMKIFQQNFQNENNLNPQESQQKSILMKIITDGQMRSYCSQKRKEKERKNEASKLGIMIKMLGVSMNDLIDCLITWEKIDTKGYELYKKTELPKNLVNWIGQAEAPRIEEAINYFITKHNEIPSH